MADQGFLSNLAQELQSGNLEPLQPASTPAAGLIAPIYSYQDYAKLRQAAPPGRGCQSCGLRGFGFAPPVVCPKGPPNNYVPTFRGVKSDAKEPVAATVFYPSTIPQENDTLVLSHVSLNGSTFTIQQSLKPGDSIRLTDAACHERYADYSIQMIEQVDAKGEKTECLEAPIEPPKPKPKHKACPKCEDPYGQSPTPAYLKPARLTPNNKAACSTCRPREGPQYNTDHSGSSNQTFGLRLTVKHVKSLGEHPFDGLVHVSYGGPIGMQLDAVGSCDGTYPFDNGEMVEVISNFSDPTIDSSSYFQINGQIRRIELLVRGNVVAPGPVSLEVTGLIFSLPPIGTLFATGVVYQSDSSIIPIGVVSKTQTSFQIDFTATVAGATQIRISGAYCLHS